MHARSTLIAVLALGLVLGACGGSSDGRDGGEDAGPDAGLDAGEDGGDPGLEVPLPGWGEILGQCGELDDEEWSSSASYDFVNFIDFGAAGFVYGELSAGGRKVYDDGNLGGSSIHSEVIAYEMLYRCELAELIKTEAEILYQDPGGKKTDILVRIDERKVGVSVTRAFHYPPTDPYTLEEGLDLLRRKLEDIQASEANAAPEDAWVRSMLHVVAYDEQYADRIIQALDRLDSEEPEVVADTIVLVTITDGEDDFVY
ncbi:MAG: hypothetical protein JXR96_10720 [Deltaproteobacteria bacterium]|nr:hypothetical protein [Deltaproteobacteria bacterium]